MIFNSLCGIAKNKIEDEKKNYTAVIIKENSQFTNKNTAERPELCTDKLTSLRLDVLKETDVIEGKYVIPIFIKGKFINAIGNDTTEFILNSLKTNNIVLNEIIFPEGIISFGGQFNTLTEYTDVTLIKLPETTKYIQAETFWNLKDLSIDISKLKNCIYFGPSCFSYDQLLVGGFDFNPNTKYIARNAFHASNFSGNNGKITIPKTITCIESSVFSNCSNLTEVEFHENITEIKSSAFASTNIGKNQTLKLPNVKKLGTNAFIYTDFEDVNIDYDNIECIEDCALLFDTNYSFFKHRKDGTFKINNKLTTLGTYWWANSSIGNKISNSYLYVDKNKEYFKEYENECLLDLTEAISLERIGDSCFGGFHKIKGSLFPPNIKKIGANAYGRGINVAKERSTDSIEYVTYNSLPDSLEILDDYWLTGFDIPMTLTTVCTENSHLQRIGNAAFSNCITAFSPSDKEYLAFCNRMEIISDTIILPASLLSLGSTAFHSQKNIKHFKVKGDETQNVLEFCDGHGSGSGIAQFENATNLVTIDFSERALTRIPVAMAHNCGSLTSFTYGGNPHTIYELAFANTSLSEFDFREGLQCIRGGAFAKGSISKAEILKNQDIVFPSTLTQIYPAAFHTCSMKSITFNEGLKEIHFDSFEKCTNVTNELVFPSTLEYIGSFAFDHYQNCSNTSITIPASVRIIGEGGDPTHTAYREYNSGSHNFYNCASKYNKEFIVEEGNQWFTTIDGVLFGKDSEGNIIRLISLPRQLKQKENTPIVNGTYTIPEGITIMDELCFNYCVGVNELVLPNSYVISATLPKSTKKLYGDTYYYANDIYTSYVNTNGNTLSVAIYTWHTLQNVTCKEDNPNYKSINGMVYSKDGKSLWYLSDCKTGDIVIAEGTERIEHGALYTQNKSRIKATSLTIPSSVVYIDSACLNYLNNCYIASGVCTVNIDSANTSYGIVDNKVIKL